MAVARHRRAAVARRHREAAAPRPICQTRCAPRAPSVSHNKNRSSDDETRARFTYPSSETSTILILVFVGGGAASSSATSFGLLVEGLSPRGVLNFHRADFARARARHRPVGDLDDLRFSLGGALRFSEGATRAHQTRAREVARARRPHPISTILALGFDGLDEAGSPERSNRDRCLGFSSKSSEGMARGAHRLLSTALERA